MQKLLSDSLRIPSISGDEARFVHFIRDFAADAGLITDLWETNEADLADHAVSRAKHLPLAGRPTLVVSLPNTGTGRSLLFNAHSDVVSPGSVENWKFGPWSGETNQGRVYGRGACDVKGPLVSALWSMLALHAAFPAGAPGALKLELVPGEEDCVTLGTLTSVVRGHLADACIVLEPTECLPRNASRPGLRFEILCTGTAVHGTVKWLGHDAIALAHSAWSCLVDLQTRWNDRQADPFFNAYPLTRPVTVDSIHGGQWQGMVCDRCTLGGYLELLPADDSESWMRRFTEELKRLLDSRGFDSRSLVVHFPETYAGHVLLPGKSLCTNAETSLEVSVDVLENARLVWSGWSGFNSGCEAGLRANLLQTPTLVWGPGSLAQAHAADEYIEWNQVEAVATLFARFCAQWTSTPRAGTAGTSTDGTPAEADRKAPDKAHKKD
jgi:acetylornithine deacetylase